MKVSFLCFFILQMKPRLASITEKNTLIKSVTGKGVDKTDMVLRSWDGIMEMLEDHRSVMKDQVCTIESPRVRSC